jgi:hypothetical protein
MCFNSCFEQRCVILGLPNVQQKQWVRYRATGKLALFCAVSGDTTHQPETYILILRDQLLWGQLLLHISHQTLELCGSSLVDSTPCRLACTAAVAAADIAADSAAANMVAANVAAANVAAAPLAADVAAAIAAAVSITGSSSQLKAVLLLVTWHCISLCSCRCCCVTISAGSIGSYTAALAAAPCSAPAASI